MNIIPVSTDPKQRFTIELGDQLVEISIRWSTLCEVWSMTIAKDGVDLIRGARLLVGIDLLGSHQLGLGSIIANAIDSPDLDPTRDDLGTRIQLVHFAEGESAPI